MLQKEYRKYNTSAGDLDTRVREMIMKRRHPIVIDWATESTMLSSTELESDWPVVALDAETAPRSEWARINAAPFTAR